MFSCHELKENRGVLIGYKSVRKAGRHQIVAGCPLACTLSHMVVVGGFLTVDRDEVSGMQFCDHWGSGQEPSMWP